MIGDGHEVDIIGSMLACSALSTLIVVALNLNICRRQHRIGSEMQSDCFGMPSHLSVVHFTAHYQHASASACDAGIAPDDYV